MVDHFHGVDDEPIIPLIRRPDLHNTGSRGLSENLKVEDLLLGVQEGNSPPEDRTKCQDSQGGPSDVDGKTNQAA